MSSNERLLLPALLPLLDKLKKVLEEERAALRALDREAIAVAAEKKLEMDAALLAHLAQGVPLADEERAGLRLLRELALENQALLGHAISCLRGALQLVPPPARGTAAPPAEVTIGRMDVRG